MSGLCSCLQKLLHPLREFCDQNGLTVKVGKSKFVVFKKGGTLEVAQSFTYR